MNWELQESDSLRFYLVRELRSGLPAEKAGLKVGDRIVACNGATLATVKTERDAKRLCQVEAGQTLQLDVRRGNVTMQVAVLAGRRPGL